MNVKGLFGLLVGILMICLPALAQEPSATLEEKPLYVYGDSVEFTATINVPFHWTMKRDGYYRIMPELGDTKFQEIHIPSNQLPNVTKEGINVTVTSRALFNEDMIGNDLEIEHEWVYKDGDKNKEFDDMDELAECCITMGMLVSPNGQYELMKFDYTPAESTPLKVVAQINFPINISEFSAQGNMDQIKVIGDYLKEHPASYITIRGFASPEGPVERNKELSEERASEAKDWLMKALKKNGYKRYFDKDNMKVSSTTEDWKGFVQMVMNSDMEQNKKTEILNIVSTTESMKETEDKLYKVVDDYDAVKDLMRPLRRATIVVQSKNAYREGYSTAQIDKILTKVNEGEVPMSSLKDIFNKEEYLQAYVQNDAKEGKLTLLASYAKQYPADMRIYSDLGALTAVDLEMFDIMGGDDALVGVGFDRDMYDVDEELDIDEDKFKYKYKIKREDVDDPEKFKIKIKADLEKMEEAKVYLEKAVEAETNNFVALNNLGAWHLTSGNFDKAKTYLMKSFKINPSQKGVNYNLAVLHAVMGDFKMAEDHLSKAGKLSGVGYNVGIIHYMNGNYEKAQEHFMNYADINSDFALAHYLVAAAAAKTDNKDVMLERLRMAIMRDDRLADVAEEDLMFRAHWDHDDFEDAADDDPKSGE